MASALSSNIDTSKFQPWQASNPTGNIQTSIGYNSPIQTGYGGYGSVQTSIPGGGPIQSSLDFSKLTALPGTSDFSADAQRVNDAVYQQATSRLDPQYTQLQNQLASSLAAKGVTEGSAAYNTAMDNFARQRTDAYNQANYSGIQAGANEQSRLFGLSLQARQQGQNEAQAQGTFANTAQQQQFAQNQAQGQFANQAQGQQYSQAQSAAAFANQAQQQGYSQAQTNADFANQAQNQGFNQQQASAATNNALRQQQMQEAAYQRNLPIQDIASLLSGNAPQNPNFTSVPSAEVAPTNTAQIAQQAYQNQWQQYQYQQQQANAGLGSLFGLAGNAASFFI